MKLFTKHNKKKEKEEEKNLVCKNISLEMFAKHNNSHIQSVYMSDYWAWIHAMSWDQFTVASQRNGEKWNTFVDMTSVEILEFAFYIQKGPYYVILD